MKISKKSLSDIEAEFFRIRCIVATAGASFEANETTAFAREAATILLSDAANDLAALHQRVHEAIREACWPDAPKIGAKP